MSQIDIETAGDAARHLQHGLDARRKVVVWKSMSVDAAPVLRDECHLVVERGATLTLPSGGRVAKHPDAARVDSPMLSGGGLIAGGLDLTGVSGFHGDALRFDTTGDASFDYLPTVLIGSGAGQYYNRVNGLHVSARRAGMHLYGTANAFSLFGGDFHLSEPNAIGVLLDATAASVNRVTLLGLSVEGQQGVALRVRGSAAYQVQVVEDVTCEWTDLDGSRRVHATGKHHVTTLAGFGDAPDEFDGNGWQRMAFALGWGSYAYPDYNDRYKVRPYP